MVVVHDSFNGLSQDFGDIYFTNDDDGILVLDYFLKSFDQFFGATFNLFKRRLVDALKSNGNLLKLLFQFKPFNAL